MSPPENKLVSSATLVVDAVLCVLFFAGMFKVLGPHVPSDNSRMIALWSAAGASCLTGVFWLCIQMFRVVLRAQKAARR